jgi:hypothetical protein
MATHTTNEFNYLQPRIIFNRRNLPGFGPGTRSMVRHVRVDHIKDKGLRVTRPRLNNTKVKCTSVVRPRIN